MRIQHNIMAMNAYRNYNTNVAAMKKNLEKLSSGYKINRAGDDAAGLAISEKMRAQITGLNAAQKNVKDGISLVQTAEGAMQEVQDMLNRMVYLGTQSANGTYDNEVDRMNLQKELDQLRSEIDRIADSANFNGIKLLDGTPGLNTDAFSISAAPAEVASGGTIAGSSIAVNDANFHGEVSGNATQANPSFTIDFGTLAGTTTAANQTLKFSILGQTVTADLGAAGAKTANDIASAARTELLKSGIGVDKTTGAVNAAGAASNDSVKIGDFVFSVGAAANGEVTFTYEGHFEGTTYKPKGGTPAPEFTTAQADAINAAIGQGVKMVAGGSADAVIAGDVIHDTTKVDYAQAKTPSTMAGVDIDLSKIIGQGNTLTIDGTTYMFQTEATAPTASNGETIINVSAGKTDAERIHMAVDLLSKQGKITGMTDGTANGREWKISSAGGNKIHIDQIVATTDTTKALKTFDDVAGVISAKTPVVAAKNVGTDIKVTDSEVKEGNTLSIDGKKYVFSDKKTGTDGDITYVAIKGGAGKNLAAAIDDSEYDADTNTVTVRAANADDLAPKVLGKGLTMQIGDTADSYNQLSVEIGDIHVATLGIDGISIADQDSAADAIAKIKSAINQVSSIRGDLGATQNRLEHTSNNLAVMKENIQDAESSIRDTDVAEEMMAYTKNNILIQSAQAMLAQANQVPQGVLQLLQ